MFAELGRILRWGICLQALGMIMLMLSLFCSTAIPYLLTIGLGSGLVVGGMILTFIQLLKEARER